MFTHWLQKFVEVIQCWSKNC